MILPFRAKTCQNHMFEQPPFVLLFFLPLASYCNMCLSNLLSHTLYIPNLFIRIHMLYLGSSICKRRELHFRPKSLEPPKGRGWLSRFFQKGQGDY